MHRLNTYPLVHTGLFHTVLSLVALIPFLERFEAEHGTLVSLALFFGRMSTGAQHPLTGVCFSVLTEWHAAFATIPGVLYILIDHVILRANTPVQGARYVKHCCIQIVAIESGADLGTQHMGVSIVVL